MDFTFSIDQSAKKFLKKAFKSTHNQMPRVITTDKYVDTSFELLRDIYRVPQMKYKKNLDRLTEVTVREFIKEINKENGVTVILTTHDMGDVEALTDRILLIGKGQILFDGSFNNLKRRYNTFSVLTVDYSGDDNISDIEDTSILSNLRSSLE